MTYNELVSAIATEIGNRPFFTLDREGGGLKRIPTRAAVKRVLEAFLKVTKKTLKSDQKVSLYGFGVFYTVVPKKTAMFGGTRQPRGKPIIRFKEARHGKAR